MEKISPKKYIETKARNLPVYKCLVNKDWEMASMANVIVMRKHVTKNVTVGFYLIDLKCLGVKDTSYKFNIPETEVSEMLEDVIDSFTEIDYTLAHNIIFAGHDFAMEFNIPPHKDFSLTKNILEEDNDDVPLIEISTGDDDGKPHLMLGPSGEGKWALEKLRKNPGEGNFYYTYPLADEDFDDNKNDDLFDEDFDLRTETLESFPVGSITSFEARSIRHEDLWDKEKLKTRNDKELLNLMAEVRIRYFELQAGYTILSDTDILHTEEYAWIDESNGQINRAEGYIFLDELDEEDRMSGELTRMTNLTEEDILKPATIFFETYHNNFFGVTQLYQLIAATNHSGLRNTICIALNNFTSVYPLAKLYLAFERACYTTGANFSNIINSENIHSCFPEYTTFGEDELLIYFLIKTLHGINENDVEKAIFYYKLAVEIMEEDILFMQTQINLASFLDKRIDLLA